MNKTLILALPLAAFLTLDGCKQAPAEADSVMPQEDTVQIEPAPEEEEVVAPKPAAPTESYFDRKVKAAKRNPSATQKKKGPKETLYVETFGAQGRVWGHVTMNGDRGTGTIHDWDENTLSVTVTRHGDELFAIDQNSRQYVFKLKK